MADIDINSLDGKWKNYAQAADEAERDSDKNLQGDKKLNLNSAFETLEFIKQAKADSKTDEEIKEFFNSKGADMDSIDAIFQLELKNKIAQNEPLSEKSVNRAANAAGRDLLEGITSQGLRYAKDEFGNNKAKVDFIKLAEAYVNYYNNPDISVENKESYKKFSNTVLEVARLINLESYNDRDSVNKLYDKVKSKLPDDDDLADFRKAVLQRFCMLAEVHQKDKENQILKNEFNNLRNGKNPEHKKYTREEAYEKIKADSRFKGSYFGGHNHLEYADKFGGNKHKYHYDGLVSDMQGSIILEDARKEVWDAVWAQRGKLNLTTSKQVEDAAEKLIHQDKWTDKVMHKNMRGEMSVKERLTGQRSVYKDFRKAVAAYNRVELNKSREYTRDDFYKGIFKGTSPDYKFNRLIQSGNVLDAKGEVLKNSDGTPVTYNPIIKTNPVLDKDGKQAKDKYGNPIYTYNITQLIEIIQRAISPANMRADYQSHASSYAEINNVIGDIKAATCVKDDNGKVIQDGVEISYNEACRLIDMCGFERDKWNVGYVLGAMGKAAADTVSDMASSATAALLVGAVQGDPLVHVQEAIFHVTDPKAHAETNIDAITKALLGMTKSFGVINPDNGVNLDLNLKLNVTVNGEAYDVNNAINEYQMMAQLDSQLAGLNLPPDAYGFEAGPDGYWHLWIHIPPDASYDDVRGLVEVLGKDFDLKTDTGVPFEAKVVIDEKGQVVIDKEAEAKVDDKGEASTNDKWQAFLWGTLVGYSLNFIKECLRGLPMEADITNTQVTETDFVSYAQRLSTEPMMKKYPRLQNALLGLAERFKNPDGSWNREGYESFLQEIAGHRSKLNRKELEIGIYKWLQEHGTSLESKKTDEQKKIDMKPLEPTKVEPEAVKFSGDVKNVNLSAIENDNIGVMELINFNEVEANYHKGNRHTWGGIVALYADTGRTRREIVAKIKEVNGIDKNDNVIPADLYLPDDLFDDGKKKKTFNDEKAQEAYIKAHDDKKFRLEKNVISHGTNRGVKVSSKFKGKKWNQADIVYTKELYDNKGEAEEAAKKLDLKKKK